MPDSQNPDPKPTDKIPTCLAELLTPEELANAFGLSGRTIARWHQYRIGPPRVVIGRKIYYRPESVSDWIISCEQPEPRPRRARGLRIDKPSHFALQRHNRSALRPVSGVED